MPRLCKSICCVALITLLELQVFAATGQPDGVRIAIHDLWEIEFTGRDRMYCFEGRDLITSAGIALEGLNAGRMNLYNMGRAVPCKIVNTGADNSVTSGTRFEFFGEYPRNDELTSKNLFTHENIYLLKFDSADPPLRFEPVAVKPLSAGRESVSSAMRTNHLERDSIQINFLPHPDLITDRTVWHNQIQTGNKWNKVFIPETLVADIDPATSGIECLIYFLGNTFLPLNPDHRWDVVFNFDYSLGHAVWDGRTDYLFRGIIDYPMLERRPVDEEFDFENLHEDGSIDAICVDWIDLKYRARLLPIHDQLEYFLPGTPENTAVQLVPGFTSSTFEIFDLTQNKELLVEPLRDEPSGKYFCAYEYPLPPEGCRFAAVGSAGYCKPSAIAPYWETKLLERLPDDLEYLAITHEKFSAELMPLIEYRQGQGLVCAWADINEIYDNYSYSRFDPNSIRKLIDDILRRQAGRSSRLKYLFLVGDASDDYKESERYIWRERAGSMVNYVPTWHRHNTEVMTDWSIIYANDDYFVYGPEGGGIPLVAVGRLPAKSAEAVRNYVNKVLEYERMPADAAWKKKMALISAESFSYNADTLIRDLGPETFRYNKIDAPQRNYTEFYQLEAQLQVLENRKKKLTEAGAAANQTELEQVRRDSDALTKALEEFRAGNRKMQQDIIDAFDSGAEAVYFVGHGSRGFWRTGSSMDSRYQTDMFSYDNIDELKNKGEYPIVFTATCFSNSFSLVNPEWRSCVGVYLVEVADKGAIASIGHVAKTSTALPTSFAAKVLNYLRKNEANCRLGDAFLNAKIELHNNMLIGMALIGDPGLKVSQYPHETTPGK